MTPDNHSSFIGSCSLCGKPWIGNHDDCAEERAWDLRINLLGIAWALLIGLAFYAVVFR